MTAFWHPEAPVHHRSLAAEPLAAEPLAATLRRAARVLEPCAARVGHPTPDDGTWLACADLLAAGGAELDRRLDDLTRVYGSREVAASFWFSWYSGSVVAPAVAAYTGERRVPDVDARHLYLRDRDPGWFDVTCFGRPRLTVLPGDPVLHRGGHASDVAVVRDTGTLRVGLVDGVLRHLEPVVAAVRQRARLGAPALWGLVAAQVGRTMVRSAELAGDPRRGREEADAFFAAASPPMRALPRWQEFVHAGRVCVGMRQGACCLAYRLGVTHCAVCPFVSDEEREQRLRADLPVR
jgi:ferric iron reductase protein FhuF